MRKELGHFLRAQFKKGGLVTAQFGKVDQNK